MTTPVEFIALIFALAVLVKMLLFLIIDPKKWMKFADGMIKKTALLNTVILLMTVVFLAFLMQEINIIQIWVSALFGMCLLGLVLVNYHKGLTEFMKEVFKEKKNSWFAWVLFTLMSLWVLYALYV